MYPSMHRIALGSLLFLLASCLSASAMESGQDESGIAAGVDFSIMLAAPAPVLGDSSSTTQQATTVSAVAAGVDFSIMLRNEQPQPSLAAGVDFSIMLLSPFSSPEAVVDAIAALVLLSTDE